MNHQINDPINEPINDPIMREQIRTFKDELNKILTNANGRRLSIKEFAIEIWENAVLQDAHYLALASLLLESVTGPDGQPNFTRIEEMVAETLAGNIPKIQEAIILMADGLVIFQTPRS